MHKERFTPGASQIVSVIILFAWLLSGCAWFQQPTELPLQEATAEQLTGLLKEREAAMQTMKGLFQAQIKGPGFSMPQRVEGAMYYSRPGLLRLRGFSRLGGELFELAMNTDSYRLRLPTTGQQFEGRVDELNQMGQVGRPFQLSAKAMIAVVAVQVVSAQDRVELVAEEDRYRLDVFRSFLVNGNNVERVSRRLWFDRRTLQVVREELLSPTGDLEGSMEFEDFRMIGTEPAGSPPATMAAGSEGMARPFRIIARDGQGSGSLILTFHEMVPNPPLRPEDLGMSTVRG